MQGRLSASIIAHLGVTVVAVFSFNAFYLSERDIVDFSLLVNLEKVCIFSGNAQSKFFFFQNPYSLVLSALAAYILIIRLRWEHIIVRNKLNIQSDGISAEVCDCKCILHLVISCFWGFITGSSLNFVFDNAVFNMTVDFISLVGHRTIHKVGDYNLCHIEGLLLFAVFYMEIARSQKRIVLVSGISVCTRRKLYNNAFHTVDGLRVFRRCNNLAARVLYFNFIYVCGSYFNAVQLCIVSRNSGVFFLLRFLRGLLSFLNGLLGGLFSGFLRRSRNLADRRKVKGLHSVGKCRHGHYRKYHHCRKQQWQKFFHQKYLLFST